MAGTYSAIRLGPDLRPSHGTVIATAPSREQLMHLWEPGRVVIGWSSDAPPPKRWPKATLARVRRQRLRRRLERKFPLIADQLYEDELAARPEYFAAEDRSQ